MDDDDLYGEFYLHDLLRAREFSGADVVGKHAHYMYLAGTDATLLRFPWMEHRFTDRVMGPTITAGRDVFRAHPFEDRNRGEDTAFLEAVGQAEGRIYSADRFNFTQMRHGESRAGMRGLRTTGSCSPLRTWPGSAATTPTSML